MTKLIKKKHLIRWQIIICICFFFLSCEKELPTISDEFVNAYIELRITSIELGDVNPNARIQRTNILKKYNYTVDSFNQEADNIRATPKLWLSFQKKVTTILDSLAEEKK